MICGYCVRSVSTAPLLVTLLSAIVAAVTLLEVTDANAADAAAAAAQRARLILPEPPQQVQQVLSVQKQLVADKNRPDAPKTRAVVVVGQIGGMPNVWPDTNPHFPWYPGQASFFMVDSKIAQQFAQHTKQHGGGNECVFCRQLAAKNVNAVAVINLVDDEGKTLPIDLRELVNLKENQTVTIRGKAKLLAGSLLQIDADGIHVHRPATASRPVGRATK